MTLFSSSGAWPAEPTGWAGFGRSLVLVLAYAACMGALVVWLAPSINGRSVITQTNFARWDADMYLYLRDCPFTVRGTGFFPLFPLWWRVLGVPPIQMSLINLATFAGAFAALAARFGLTWQRQLLALSVPSMMFMALPFSEAVFFVGGLLILLGLRQARSAPWLLALGLLMSCFTRSAAVVMLPAIVLTLLLTAPRTVATLWRGGGAFMMGLLGLLLSVYVHFLDTGRWFVFFAAQREWDNRLRWPDWPLSSWGSAHANRYEAVAFLAGAAGAGYLLYLLWRHWRRPMPAGPGTAPVVFALAYTAGVTLVTLATKGGLLPSLSRYVFATPYCVLLLGWLGGGVPITTRRLGWTFLLAEVCWLLCFGATDHIRSVLWYSVVSLYVVLVLATAHPAPLVRRVSWGLVIVANSGIMVWFFHEFLSNRWVA